MVIFSDVLSASDVADLDDGTTTHGDYASLVALWWLDEGSGNHFADSSGNGLDGTLTGSYSWETACVP